MTNKLSERHTPKTPEPNKTPATGAQPRKPLQAGLLDVLLGLGVAAGNEIPSKEPKLEEPKEPRER